MNFYVLLKMQFLYKLYFFLVFVLSQEFISKAIPKLLPVATMSFRLCTYAQSALLTFWCIAEEHKMERVFREHAVTLVNFFKFAQTNA